MRLAKKLLPFKVDVSYLNERKPTKKTKQPVPLQN